MSIIPPSEIVKWAKSLENDSSIAWRNSPLRKIDFQNGVGMKSSRVSAQICSRSKFIRLGTLFVSVLMLASTMSAVSAGPANAMPKAKPAKTCSYSRTVNAPGSSLAKFRAVAKGGKVKTPYRVKDVKELEKFSKDARKAAPVSVEKAGKSKFRVSFTTTSRICGEKIGKANRDVKFALEGAAGSGVRNNNASWSFKMPWWVRNIVAPLAGAAFAVGTTLVLGTLLGVFAPEAAALPWVQTLVACFAGGMGGVGFAWILNGEKRALQLLLTFAGGCIANAIQTAAIKDGLKLFSELGEALRERAVTAGVAASRAVSSFGQSFAQSVASTFTAFIEELARITEGVFSFRDSSRVFLPVHGWVRR